MRLLAARKKRGWWKGRLALFLDADHGAGRADFCPKEGFPLLTTSGQELL